jgi:hypothetical protein
LAKTNRPPALRSLITKPDFYNTNSQVSSMYTDVFTDQVLTAQSWYHGYDADAADRIMGELIDSVVAGTEATEAISMAVRKVQQTFNSGSN